MPDTAVPGVTATLVLAMAKPPGMRIYHTSNGRKLLHELERTKKRYGLQTMCIGHGMATTTIIERVG